MTCFPKRENIKLYSIAKFCIQRSSSWKHCQSYKENARLRNFPFCIIAALLIIQFRGCTWQWKEERESKQWKRLCLEKAGSWCHTGTEMHCSDRAWCWASCSLVADFLLFPRVDKWVFYPGRREQYFFPVTAQAPWLSLICLMRGSFIHAIRTKETEKAFIF